MTGTQIAETSPEELAGLSALLDEIIPPSAPRGMPGAGEAGLAHEIAAQVPDLLPTLRAGLAALDEKARSRGAADFTALPREQRGAALRELDAEEPGFLPGLLYHTYARYYRLAPVLEALGLEARPPFPKGYELEPVDAERLASLRGRPRLYREP